jgi:hypothetical protein
MSEVGFEPTIPVFERAESVHVSDREATVIGSELNGMFNTVKTFFYDFFFAKVGGRLMF